MKTLPRPAANAPQVIYTVNDLPRQDSSPHDEVFDAQGNVWYSDFNSQFIGKLDPKSGKVQEYSFPVINRFIELFHDLVEDRNELKMVALMKELVPEFRSNYSRFEILDEAVES